MDKNIYGIVTEAVRNQEEADEYMTSCLQALEDLNWDEAMRASHAVLESSQNIEQRLAAILLFSLAVERNELATSAFIAIAYGHE